MENEKKSALKEAITSYKEIQEAADANAKKKLAEEFPEKFNNLLKEELNKNKNKSKESYKKLDEVKESDKDDIESNKDTVMKNQEQETKKVVKETAGEGKPFNEKAKGVAKVEEDVHITDTVGEGDPFDKKAKKGEKVEEDVHITDTVGDSDPFDKKAKGEKMVDETAGDGKPFNEKAKKPLQTEEFDITGLDASGAGSAVENADSLDEFITMDEIESEIANMENLGGALEGKSVQQETGGDAYSKLVEMRKQIDEILGEMHSPGQETFGSPSQVAGLHKDGPTDALIDEKNVEEMHSPGETTYGSTDQINRQHAEGPTDKLIDENPGITDADIENVLGAPKEEESVDEHLGITLANNKKVTATLPGYDYKPESHKQHTRSAVQNAGGMVTGIQESKKFAGLIEDNKKLTKELNETKKYKQSVTTLVESYKTALDKYRNQLKEMAIFNTNLAHVNNLLVNESLALTQDDKIKIINEFKKVNTITESQKVYKNFLTEMKGSKKTLTESIENKVSASIQPSSKQKLDEVVEKTAYANDEHINKMKRLIEYVENRGKKIIK